ncbi:response regulator [Phormidium sp. LEGE 05292]|uniref:response regulator n=1 Tax=[Phormidium] sp. LEGE 05292 TaxID=767427 RepID=UPI0018812E1A|nr:response regulator [Phormidium sp. LEGE 05292]MBE9229390.1 response regulator [Phormidium sp. LEGE 05292]
MRILLIEDDEVLTNVLLESLTSQHYLVDAIADGELGWEYVQSTPYDLILMDVGLPKLDGISLCSKLRNSGCSTPILLMTAKDANSDRIRGLDAGADDYLIKPLDLAELHARVRALLRRGEVPHTPVLQVGELKLDPSSCQVTFQDKIIPLTPKEYNLLELFLRNPSRVFSRANIVEHLWSFDDPPLEESVKAHIKGLRQKMRNTGAGNWIENVYGLGYRLNPEQANSENAKSKNANSKLDAAPSVQEQFNQAMEVMWQKYQSLMAERLDVLQTAATAIQTGEIAEELRLAASKEAHKLAGVLGMFEWETGTLIAKEIEQLLESGRILTETKVLSLIEDLAKGIENRGKGQNKTETLDVKPFVSLKHSSTDTRLLLIDPNPELGEKLQEITQSTGENWSQVATLEAAKNWLQNKSPDLVVLSIDDIGQRQKSLELLTNLAQRTPVVPVIVLAAGDCLVDRITVARSGGKGFLTKPVTASQIWDLASQILQQSRRQTINLLVVDDDPIFLATLPPMLSPWGMRITGLDDPLKFWEVLKNVSPNLLILDVEMPNISGIELCQAVRNDPNWQELPILFLTAHQDVKIIQQVFAAGADDYLFKPVVAVELLTRITNRLERNRLLQTLSTKDPQTGVLNQIKSSRDLESLLQQAATNKYAVCLAFFSVYQLRQINIKYGHNVGNQVLQRWGQLFQSAFRGDEILGYWGIGEFVVGMPGLSKLEASDRLNDILTNLRQQVFSAPDGSRFQVSCNFAIVEYPTEGMTLQSLYQVASKSLE